MSINLPRGYSTYDMSDWGVYVPPPEEKPLTKRCTCGILITMGKDADIQFHSFWCDLVRKEDKE